MIKISSNSSLAYLIIPFILLSACATQKGWNYEKASEAYDEYLLNGYNSAQMNKKQWADPDLECDPDSSFLPFVAGRFYEINVSSYEAFKKKEEGTVRLTYKIDTTGTTRDIKLLVPATETLNRIMVESVEQTKYVPGYCNGKPETAVSVYQFTFEFPQLRDEETDN